MKRLFSILSAVILALLFAVSCVREDDDIVKGNPEWPASFADFMKSYYGGKYYESAAKADTYVTFTFIDGSSASISLDDLKVIDCNIFDVPSVAADPRTGEWTINMVRTGIYKDTSLSLEDSYPICMYYDDDCIFVVMSNAQTLALGKDPSGSLQSFSFLMKDNWGLSQDITCEIDGNSVTGNRPLAMPTLTLIPRFEYRGKRVTVDGQPQESGVTKQDFSKPVRYDIELFDGSTWSFTVTLVSGVDFPTVFIYTEGNRTIKKDSYVPGTVRFEDPKRLYSDTTTLEAHMQIKGRGNSTWGMPKKPYRIRLDEKSRVYGLPKNRDWVLMANYADKSLLRNEVAMEISKACGLSWTPTFYPVEVYLNDQYQGCYDFGDHKEVAKHRVDIEVVKETDNSGDAVTGGYYFEIEQQLDEPVCWTTKMGVPMMFKDPEYPTQAQQKYVKDYFLAFENALQSSDFKDPEKGYAKYVDIDSWINYYIVQELTKNIDGNLRKSTFITKERGKKLEFYHVWDFDLTIGNCDYFNSYGISGGPTTFFIKDYGYQGYGSGWYYRVMQDENFRRKVKNRWNEVRPKLLAVKQFIDTQSEYIRPAADRNFRKWDILNVYVWPNRRIPGSYSGEIEYLKSFYSERLDWLDTEINKW